jgi:hypothetical protein
MPEEADAASSTALYLRTFVMHMAPGLQQTGLLLSELCFCLNVLPAVAAETGYRAAGDSALLQQLCSAAGLPTRIVELVGAAEPGAVGVVSSSKVCLLSSKAICCCCCCCSRVIYDSCACSRQAACAQQAWVQAWI